MKYGQWSNLSCRGIVKCGAFGEILSRSSKPLHERSEMHGEGPSTAQRLAGFGAKLQTDHCTNGSECRGRERQPQEAGEGQDQPSNQGGAKPLRGFGSAGGGTQE
jgi:hypothetical protein